ncbi:hypothetical protein QAD02_003527 [Eretmocerus hayati]|uniref:Uncharacterized protein n=1 Tax=Eretmocerus hayati TaxID=131215 RepID=A0ACC2NN25_9HYME|nr:hypothetical protein QAD02_003527 [Eretmocerus hayati]
MSDDPQLDIEMRSDPDEFPAHSDDVLIEPDKSKVPSDPHSEHCLEGRDRENKSKESELENSKSSEESSSAAITEKSCMSEESDLEGASASTPEDYGMSDGMNELVKEVGLHSGIHANLASGSPQDSTLKETLGYKNEQFVGENTCNVGCNLNSSSKKQEVEQNDVGKSGNGVTSSGYNDWMEEVCRSSSGKPREVREDNYNDRVESESENRIGEDYTELFVKSACNLGIKQGVVEVIKDEGARCMGKSVSQNFDEGASNEMSKSVGQEDFSFDVSPLNEATNQSDDFCDQWIRTISGSHRAHRNESIRSNDNRSFAEENSTLGKMSSFSNDDCYDIGERSRFRYNNSTEKANEISNDDHIQWKGNVGNEYTPTDRRRGLEAGTDRHAKKKKSIREKESGGHSEDVHEKKFLPPDWDSNLMNIWEVTHLSQEEFTVSLEDILQKFVRLGLNFSKDEEKRKFVVPLLHERLQFAPAPR